MEFLGWVWWLVSGTLGIALSLIWFLIGGWVSTLAQIAVIALLIYGYKFGWRQAPSEIVGRFGNVARRFWGWARVREVPSRVPDAAVRERTSVRVVRRSRPGDVNVSTLLNLLMLAGLGAVVLF